MCVHVCTVCVDVCVYDCMYLFLCMCVCVCARTCVCMIVCFCACAFLCMFTCAFESVCLYVRKTFLAVLMVVCDLLKEGNVKYSCIVLCFIVLYFIVLYSFYCIVYVSSCLCCSRRLSESLLRTKPTFTLTLCSTRPAPLMFCTSARTSVEGRDDVSCYRIYRFM